jgi:hypothetical protein
MKPIRYAVILLARFSTVEVICWVGVICRACSHKGVKSIVLHTDVSIKSVTDSKQALNYN